MTLFERILAARGLSDADTRRAFLTPSYEAGRHDPFLLPDMEAAVERLIMAHDRQERITIYGDYDIDGLTASTLLLDAFESFGYKHVECFIPNRFVEGYGLTKQAIEKIVAAGAELIITVDCGSLSTAEIEFANSLDVDVIVTDHHNVLEVQPPAVAVINPKRLLQDFPEKYRDFILKDFSATSSETVASSQQDSATTSSESAELPAVKQSSIRDENAAKSSGLDQVSSEAAEKSPELYPFLDLPGVGVAFKLVQALQTRLDGLDDGQEKWLLDLVALGTVCDVVTLADENRMHVYWGLRVLAKTRRPGLKALMAVAGVKPEMVNARSLGFALGPRMNAAGRLETAQIALDMLTARDGQTALDKAYLLDDMNAKRRAEQDNILKQALVEAEQRADDPVLVVSAPGWNHGIIGIVAAKLLEKYQKPTYVLEEIGEESKGSARSYGDFSAADAIRAADDIITKGGGHKLAAGVTLPTARIDDFRVRVNQHYRDNKLSLVTQQALLLPREDASAGLDEITETLVTELAKLEPYGNGNPQPIIKTENVTVQRIKRMGAEQQHVKLTLSDGLRSLEMLAFNAPEHFFVEPGEIVTIWYHPDINEWQGRRSVEGRLLHLEQG